MLQLSAINPATLELLNTLMTCDEFSKTRLVGGTAMALQVGHRKSLDLDLFGEIDFEIINKTKVFKKFNEVVVLKASKNINIFSINGVKIDFVNYDYPWLQEIRIENKIRLARLEDIAAMKLAAITGRGSKKDFIDIYFLLKRYKLRELMEFYNKKYFDGSEYLVLKSLTYYEDAENDVMPEMLVNVAWKMVRKRIQDEVVSYLK